MHQALSLKMENFNTSNVNVQPCRYFTSSKTYKDFNTSNVNVQRMQYRQQQLFQQISIHQMSSINVLILTVQQRYFNTSNVNVQLVEANMTGIIFTYFNTSNVNVQHAPDALTGVAEENFNTSNVNVQHD